MATKVGNPGILLRAEKRVVVIQHAPALYSPRGFCPLASGPTSPKGVGFMWYSQPSIVIRRLPGIHRTGSVLGSGKSVLAQAVHALGGGNLGVALTIASYTHKP